MPEDLCVVIPAMRDVGGLLADLAAQRQAQIEVVRNVSPSGRARNLGAARTGAAILVFVDDDVRLPCPDTLRTLQTLLERDPTLGLVGTAQRLPDESTPFQRSIAAQIPRSQSPVVDVLTESDMVTTACCAIRAELFHRLGGFHAGLERGVDPELRHRLRQQGYRIAVAPGLFHTHPVPGTLKAFLRLAFRDGRASARAAKNYPEAVLYNPDGHVARFQARQSFPQRVARRLIQTFQDVLHGRWLGLSYTLAYAAGYALA